MEFLKKSMILLAITAMMQFASAQVSQSQMVAFSSSYKLEKAAKYVDAINVTKAIDD